MTYCKEEIRRLKARRRYWKGKLLSLLDEMAPVTVSRTYHVCGNPNCRRCREEGGKHGPFLYATYKDRDHKTRTLYVNVGLEDMVDRAHEAWNGYKEIGRKIGEINRELLRLEIEGRRRKR